MSRFCKDVYLGCPKEAVEQTVQDLRRASGILMEN